MFKILSYLILTFYSSYMQQDAYDLPSKTAGRISKTLTLKVGQVIFFLILSNIVMAAEDLRELNSEPYQVAKRNTQVHPRKNAAKPQAMSRGSLTSFSRSIVWTIADRLTPPEILRFSRTSPKFYVQLTQETEFWRLYIAGTNCHVWDNSIKRPIIAFANFWYGESRGNLSNQNLLAKAARFGHPKAKNALEFLPRASCPTRVVNPSLFVDKPFQYKGYSNFEVHQWKFESRLE